MQSMCTYALFTSSRSVWLLLPLPALNFIQCKSSMTTTAANPLKHPIRRFIPGILPHRHIWYYSPVPVVPLAPPMPLPLSVFPHISSQLYFGNMIRMYVQLKCTQPPNHITCTTDYHHSFVCTHTHTLTHLCLHFPKNVYFVYANSGLLWCRLYMRDSRTLIYIRACTFGKKTAWKLWTMPSFICVYMRHGVRFSLFMW